MNIVVAKKLWAGYFFYFLHSTENHAAQLWKSYYSSNVMMLTFNITYGKYPIKCPLGLMNT